MLIQRKGESLRRSLGLATCAAILGGSASAQCTAHVAQRFWADDLEPYDRFGSAVAVDGDVMAVGAFASDNAGRSAAGAVYIFVRDGSGEWIQSQELWASDPESGADFGASVALSGDTLAVGAPWEDLAGNNSGAVYLFRNDGSGHWSEFSRFVGSDTVPRDNFGEILALRGDDLFIGVPSKFSGDYNEGVVYHFRNDGTGNWLEAGRLRGFGAQRYGIFGSSLALSADTLIVGAPGDDRVHVFRDDGTGTWRQVAYLSPPDTGAHDLFGSSVAIWNDLVAVGSPRNEETGNARDNFGAVYVFQDDGNWDWPLVQKLTPDIRFPVSEFGLGVGISDQYVFVGSFYAKAWLFRNDGTGGWSEVHTVDVAEMYSYGRGDPFGVPSIVRGDIAYVGYEGDNANGARSGAVYELDLNEPQSTPAFATEIQMIRGELVSGSPSDLDLDDGNLVHTISGLGSWIWDLHLMEMAITLHSDVASPSCMNVIVKSTIDAPLGAWWLMVRNRNTGENDVLIQSAIVDGIEIKKVFHLDAEPYIDQNGEIKLTLKHKAFIFMLGYKFESYIEQVSVEVN